jgi:hypothetical protein
MHIADRGLIEMKWFVRIARASADRHQDDRPRNQKAHEFLLNSHRE